MLSSLKAKDINLREAAMAVSGATGANRKAGACACVCIWDPEGRKEGRKDCDRNMVMMQVWKWFI